MCVVDVADEEDVTELAGGRGQGGGAMEEARHPSSGASREIRELLARGRQTGPRTPHALPTSFFLILLFLLSVDPPLLSPLLPSPPSGP